MTVIPSAAEFNPSIRVADLDANTAFYAALLGVVIRTGWRATQPSSRPTCT
jgi:hypothetical protein